MFDHAERYRRLHIGHGPTAWATADHREILDACKARERAASAGELASHLARTRFEVSKLLDPEYSPRLLELALADAVGSPPKKARRRR